MLEFLQSHTSVVYQPPSKASWYSGINPYALALPCFRISSVSANPRRMKIKRWFPDIAGSDWLQTLDFAMRNFRTRFHSAPFLSA